MSEIHLEIDGQEVKASEGMTLLEAAKSAAIKIPTLCYLEGLETTEQKLGWAARSGKIVLRIALQRLRRHYDGLHDGGGLVG